LLPLICQLLQKYDNSFIALLGLQYFNQGATSLVFLAQTSLFKDHYKLEPSNMQFLFSYIGIPWTTKIVYGIVSDNFPICGSHRRSYLIIGSLLQIVSMTLLSLNCIPEYDRGEIYATVCLTLGGLSIAMMDVILDSLMVIQARKFPNGEDDLQTYSWAMMSIGGIVGAVAAAILTEGFPPHYSFIGTAVLGLFLGIGCLFLNKEIEA